MKINLLKNNIDRLPLFFLFIGACICAFLSQLNLYLMKNLSVGLILFFAMLILLFLSDKLNKRNVIEKPPDIQTIKTMSKFEPILFVLMIISAVFFRFYQLEQIPPESQRDEAEAVMIATDIFNNQKPDCT
jgi:hypothetical protein